MISTSDVRSTLRNKFLKYFLYILMRMMLNKLQISIELAMVLSIVGIVAIIIGFIYLHGTSGTVVGSNMQVLAFGCYK